MVTSHGSESGQYARITFPGVLLKRRKEGLISRQKRLFTVCFPVSSANHTYHSSRHKHWYLKFFLVTE
ncbi:hypothetical protein GN956_G13658 [Arapaima gigas]